MSTAKDILLATCEEYKDLMFQWRKIKKQGPADQAAWRLKLRAAIRRCRAKEAGVEVQAIPDDCDPDEIIGLASILSDLTLIVQTYSPSDPGDKRKREHEEGEHEEGEHEEGRRSQKSYKVGGGGSKMVGGALYEKLVAQLKNLVTWLKGHGAGISNCAKWFLQKIWEAAKVAAEAVSRAKNWGVYAGFSAASTVSDTATATVSLATTTAAQLAQLGEAAAHATGLTDMGELLLLIIDAGDAAFQD